MQSHFQSRPSPAHAISGGLRPEGGRPRSILGTVGWVANVGNKPVWIKPLDWFLSELGPPTWDKFYLGAAPC